MTYHKSHVGGKQKEESCEGDWGTDERRGEGKRMEMKTDAILSYIGDIKQRAGDGDQPRAL